VAGHGDGLGGDPDAHAEIGGAALNHAPTRFMGFSVSVSVRPAAERKRGLLPSSPMPAAFM
jgi:hypothetical protein